MNILITLNSNYIPPLKVMLFSLFQNCGEKLDIYMIHSDINKNDMDELSNFVEKRGHSLHPLKFKGDEFSMAPVKSYYSKEMYYRLLAHTILPDNVDKVLYLDPDILVINSIDSLYYTPLGKCFFAAAAHEKPMIGYINKIRLKTDSSSYYNSGVLLMNIARIRKELQTTEIFDFVKDHMGELLLPDQDILNGLYWDKINPLDECIYNYDARRYRSYLLSTKGKVNIDYIINNTVILHFCGKQKPWSDVYPYRFGILYKHYKKMMLKEDQR